MPAVSVFLREKLWLSETKAATNKTAVLDIDGLCVVQMQMQRSY